MENELFGLSLNEEGREQLQKFSGKARAIFIASLVLTVINFITVIGRVNTIFGVYRYTSRGLSTQLLATLAYLIFTLIIIPFQWYYYFAFSKVMKESIGLQDNTRFNRSFSLLNTQATICLLAILANILYFAYAYYGTWVIRGRF